MIELRRLHRFFGRTKAVNDISFEVQKGQVFGYIGPNGAGKTTSMRILATLELPSFGDAFVDGFSVLDDPDRVRTRLASCPTISASIPTSMCGSISTFLLARMGCAAASAPERSTT
jgi:ABC-2 type transport system ATP-binding protein